MPKHFFLPAVLVAGLVVAVACERDSTSPDRAGDLVSAPVPALSTTGAVDVDRALLDAMTLANRQLAADGRDFRFDRAEWLAVPGADEIGRTVFFDDRTLRLDEHFVPGDPRRGGRTNITWQFDRSDGAATGLTLAQTGAATDRAMATWDGMRCSTLPLTKLPDFGLDLGVVEFLVTQGAAGIPFALSDVTHAGWVAIDALFGADVLAATFTAVFIDNPQDRNPTDINGDGRLDTAIREIYYNNNFAWGIDTPVPIDVESVALHEAGHGLSQGHFGSLFRTDANGIFHFAPRSVMNAGYTGVQQNLTGTDDAGHCDIWGRWPRR